MKRYLLILMIVLIFGSGYADQYVIVDSLKSELDNTHEIADKVKLYIQLSHAYKNVNIDTAVNMAVMALKLAQKINAVKDLGIIHAYLGDFALMKDSVAQAEKEYLKATSIGRARVIRRVQNITSRVSL